MRRTAQTSIKQFSERQLHRSTQNLQRPIIVQRALSSVSPAIAPTSFAGPSNLHHQYATQVGVKPSTSDQLHVIPDISPEDTYDIVIIGGGNAGLALACALSDKPSIKATSRILLLEGGTLDRVRSWDDQGPWENRISSLTATNVEWLKEIGVWKHVAQKRSCPVDEMQIWANPDSSSIPSLNFPYLGYPMAYMTENTNLQRAFLRRMDEDGKGIVDIREGARVGQMQLGQGEQWVGLRIGEGKWVRGSVVVGADGPNSPVRHFSNIESYGHGYDTHGVVATLNHAALVGYTNNTAFQRFLPTGPLAFLPLSPTASTMVWSTHPSHAAAYKRLSPEALVHMVNAGYTMYEEPLDSLTNKVLAADKAGTPLDAEMLAGLVRDVNMNGNASITSQDLFLPSWVENIPAKSIASFPLRLSHADTYLGNRAVLVGDAAHTVHPLAGQGLNMGLADVRSLANVWESARRVGSDFGSKSSSIGYPKERYHLNALMLTTTDQLHHVFRNRSGAVNQLRSWGLDVLNELGPIKNILMHNAGATPGKGASPTVEGGERGGWPKAAASGLEGWLGVKTAVGNAATLAGQVVTNVLRNTADSMDKRQTK